MPERAAEFLLVNDNNTRTKFALASRDGLIEHRSMAAGEVEPERVASLLEGWEYERVLLASVVPAHVPVLETSQDGRPLARLTHRLDLGVAVDFPDPETVGADRLANAAAVAGRFPGEPVVVVDFGTAVTFDIVDDRPAYIGGVIAPGLDAMRHYLHQRTALLPEIEIVRPASAIGKTTEHAMQSGAYHGYRGLVRQILGEIAAEMECRPKVIATGGYAALIADGLPEVDEVDPALTMEGLLAVAKHTFSE